MGFEETLPEKCAHVLMAQEGGELEIMANFRSPKMLDAVEESSILGNVFGMGYSRGRYTQILRYTIGYGARGRDDMVKVATMGSEDPMDVKMNGLNAAPEEDD